MTTPIACPKCDHVNQVESEDLPNYLAGKEIGEMTCGKTLDLKFARLVGTADDFLNRKGE